MAIQVIAPFTRGFDRMKWILFQPFDLKKWFVLGFTAFLAFGGGGGARMDIPGKRFGEYNRPHGFRGALPSELGEARHWFDGHVALVVAVVAVLAVVLLVLVLVWAWISSRGRFMFLDNVVFNRAAVVEPWRRFRRQGNRLFGFQLLFMGVLWLSLVLVGGLGFLLALPDIRAEVFGPSAVVALFVAVPLFVVWLLAGNVVLAIVECFVVPVMYLRGVGVRQGFGVFRREILPGRLGAIVCFFLFRVALVLAAAVLVTLVGCLTCCIGFLPYLSSVLTLPIAVALQSYTLYFLQQFGEGFRFFAASEPPASPPIPPVVLAGSPPPFS